jgi:hypothetical protein
MLLSSYLPLLALKAAAGLWYARALTGPAGRTQALAIKTGQYTPHDVH